MSTQGFADKCPRKHNEGDLCFLETGPEHEGVKMSPQSCGIKLLWRRVLDGNSFISGREKYTAIAFY